MPKRKRSRSTKKRRSTKRRRTLKRRRWNAPLVRRQMPGFKGYPFGQRFATTLRYNESHTFGASTTAGFCSSYNYALNSLYDPNVTGAGHQPRGFDQLMEIYQKYTVVGAKISVKIIPDNTVPGIAGLRVVDRNDGAATLTDKKTAIEQGDCVWRYHTTANGGKNMISLSKKFSTKKYFNLKSLIGDDDFTKVATANPPADKTAVAQIFVGPVSSADTHGRYTMDVTIEYACVFTEPKPLGGS